MYASNKRVKAVWSGLGFFKGSEYCVVPFIDQDNKLQYMTSMLAIKTITKEEYEAIFEGKFNREWTSWNVISAPIVSLEGSPVNETVEIRNNGKLCEVRYKLPNGDYIKSKSTCHRNDNFSAKIGYDIALKRLNLKIFDYKIKNDIRRY